MKIIMRALVGILGIAALAIAIRFWIAPAAMAAQLGFAIQRGLGIATMRADLAGFFGGTGAIALAAAVLDRARLLTAPLVLVAVALAGRLVTAFSLGLSPEFIAPMVAEALLIAIFALGRRTLGSE